MGPDLWEMFEEGKADDEVAAIIRLGQSAVLPKGVRVVTQFSEIITVRMKREILPVVSGAPEVASMIAGNTYLGPDIELDAAEISEASVLTPLPTDERRPQGLKVAGRGVVVGVVDWGFDFTHPDFRNKDGTTRILALWDQRCGRRSNSPEPFGYGVVHDRAAINRALKENDPFRALDYHPADADTGIGCHGTHVASIAAGSGGDDRPVGIAPEADFVLVHNSPWDEATSNKLGDSVTLLEGVDFIARTAGDRSWVVNLSMGRHGEQHDGSTLIEQGLDAVIRLAPGRAVSLSAGNYFDKRIHASGQLRPTQERTLVWEIAEGKRTYNQLEFWYSWQDKFEVAVRSPDGSIAGRAGIGERAKFVVGGREVGNIYHRAQEPNNLDHHISIFLYEEAPTGEWQVTISGRDVIDGRYHAWIERDVSCPKCQSRFHADDADPKSTTGTICNGRRTLAVGAYDAHDPEQRLGRFSSVGPTRDGRLKPDLCAPGVRVLAARSAPRNKTDDTPLLTRMSGTSMAAPHVAGTIALMFEAAPRRLRIEETHNLLLESARRVSVPEAIPDRVGIGFLDIAGAVAAAQKIARSDTSFKQTTFQTPSSPKNLSARPEGSEQEWSEGEAEFETQEGRAEAEYETEFEVAHDDQNTFHRIANDITGAFEGGRTGTLNLYDLGVISYGKHQATLASGTLLGILRRFSELSTTETAKGISSYLDRVKLKDESLREDTQFIRLLKDAAKEPEMNQAQEEEFSRQYWEPAKRKAAAHRIKTALGHAIFYDTQIQGGLSQVVKRVETRLEGKPGDTVREKVIGELESLTAFVDERIQRNLRISANQRKQAQELIASAQKLEEQAAGEPSRADQLRSEAAQKRKKAKQYEANAAALERSSNKTRGPSFRELVESGDLNLYDGDAGKIFLKGKAGMAIPSLKPGAAIDANTPAEAEFAPSDTVTVAAECACQHAGQVEAEGEFEFEAEQFRDSTEVESLEGDLESGESMVIDHDVASEWEGDEAMDTQEVFSESFAEDIIPTPGACSSGSVDCLFPPEVDTKKIRPKGRPEGDFVDRTKGDPATVLALQLTDYDVNAYTASKARHAEALGKIREFITNRFVQTTEDIAVTITGSASRTGGKDYNDALSCKRALCAADSLRRSLETFRGVMDRVRINAAGEGFARATCKGSDCELGEWRSVLIQVHAPNKPPEPLPVVDPGWDKYTIRCCEFHTELLLSSLLGDLLKKGLPQIPDKLKGKLVKLIEKGLKKLTEVLQKALPKLQGVFKGISALLELFPAEIIRERGTFEIRERDTVNPRGVVLCYSGIGLRILFPRQKIDEFIDEAIDKIPGMKQLPDFLKKQIRDEIKKAIPDLIKTLAQPIDSSTPGPLARFDLLHPRKINVFEGSVQIGKAIWMPGRVNVQFDSPPWGTPDPLKRPKIVSCPDTDCNEGGIQAIVGDGLGLELFSITAGDLVRGSCVCAVPAPAGREAELAEYQRLIRTPSEVVEVAEQVVIRQENAAAVDVLHEVFERVGRGEALASGDSEGQLSAAEIFDSFAYPGRPKLRNQLEQNFEVVALPGTPLNLPLREADMVFNRGDGQAAHVSFIKAPELRDLESLEAEGLTPESFTRGNYAQVIEGGAFPHESSDRFARRITEPKGIVPSDSLILRLRPGAAAERAEASFSERGSRLLDDLLLIRLATPTPAPVVVMQPGSAPAKEAPATPDAESDSEGEASCTHIDASKLSWPRASADQSDFMRRVYLRQVRAACQSHSFVTDVPDSELSPIEDNQRARTAAADSCRRLLASARAAIAQDPAAAHVKSIGVASGYRSASQQLHNWNRNFPRYFGETSSDRAALEGGEFGEAAEKLLTRYISGRLAAPGFSLHNNGLAIDFSALERGISMGPSTTKQSRQNWRKSWYFA
jgi:subtilisin family serine protease